MKLMKQFYYFLVATLFAVCTFTSCQKAEGEFEEAQLYSNGGKWETASLSANASSSDKLIYIYYSDGTGITWDEGDDVTQSEASHFKWEVDSSDMIHIYKMESDGADVPQYYTLLTLTTTTLKYRETNGKVYTFTKA